MDLFNPPKLFNYKTMSHKLDVSTLDNPYLQVIWEDTPENFTQERLKSVKQYFQKKYNTTLNTISTVKKFQLPLVLILGVMIYSTHIKF